MSKLVKWFYLSEDFLETHHYHSRKAQGFPCAVQQFPLVLKPSMLEGNFLSRRMQRESKTRMFRKGHLQGGKTEGCSRGGENSTLQVVPVTQEENNSRWRQNARKLSRFTRPLHSQEYRLLRVTLRWAMLQKRPRQAQGPWLSTDTHYPHTAYKK